MKATASFRPDIQGLRAIAVMAVVLFHAEISWFSGGFIGVDVFFVISGYLITRSIKREAETGSFSFPAFYTRRARRLFPALFVTLALTTVGAALCLSPPLLVDFGYSLAAAVASLANIYFWTDAGYFDKGAILKPLLHTWSLSVEEQFYLFWPVALLLMLRLKRPWVPLVLLGALSFVALVFWAGSSSTTFFWTPFRVFQFAAGGVLAWLPVRPKVNIRSEIANITGLALLAFGILTFNGDTSQVTSGLVASIGAMLVLVGGGASVSGLVLRNPLSVYLGKISYSVYLAHWPIVVFLAYLLQRDFSRFEKASLVLVAVAMGHLLYRTVEDRFRYPSEHRSLKLGRYWLAYGAAVAVTCGVGLNAAHAGWPWRLGDRGQVFEAIFSDSSSKALVAYGGDDCRPPCSTLNSTAPADLIVIGDSHSRQYYAGFAASFPDLNIRFYESSGCQFFSPSFTRDFVDTGDPALYFEPCVNTRKSAFAEIRKSKAPVILAEFWNDFGMVDEKTGVPFPKYASLTEYFRSVASEISALKSQLGISKLIVIGSVPTTGSVGIPIDCMGRIQGSNECAQVPRTEPTLSRRAEINDTLRSALADDITFYDPFDALCSTDSCLVMDGIWPLYSDNTHLSGKGSEVVISNLRSNIQINLKRPPSLL